MSQWSTSTLLCTISIVYCMSITLCYFSFPYRLCVVIEALSHYLLPIQSLYSYLPGNAQQYRWLLLESLYNSEAQNRGSIVHQGRRELLISYQAA